MKVSRFIILLIGIAAAIHGCRTTKKIQTVIAKKDTVLAPVAEVKVDSTQLMQEVLAGINRNRIDFKTFSAKVKVDFEGKDGKKNDFNAFVRLKKDSALWIVINWALGLEAFRVLITPDSVKVLNKLEKVVQLRSVEYLQEVVKIPLTFYELQDLLVGNAVYLDSNLVSYKKQDDLVSIVTVGAIFKNLTTVTANDFILQNSKLDDIDVMRARTCLITYGDYEVKNGIRFSTFRKITVSEKAKLDIELNFKQFDFNVELGFPFSIPKNYKYQ